METRETWKLEPGGRTDKLLDPQEADLEFEISGPDLQALGQTFGVDELVAAPYRFKGDI